MSVQIEQLSKHFGTQKAVDQISFSASKGKILGFLGPNGAGKSTTMKMITGYWLPTSGEVWVDEVPVTSQALKVKRKIGYLPEHNPMYPDMYISEFLQFIGQAVGLSTKHARVRVNELIQTCGLTVESHKKIRMLSKGYRQRVGLAKALMGDPSVLILDEPTSGLDPNQLLEIRKVIKEISKEKTVILSTHIMQEVEALCDDVVIINRGKIVANQSLAELRKHSSTSKIKVTFESAVDKEEFSGLTDVEKEPVSELEWVFTSSDSQLRSNLLSLISAKKLPLSAIQDVGGSLEEIFHDLTNKEVNT